MVLPYCNKFSTQHSKNIQLSDNDEKAVWVEKSHNLFRFSVERKQLYHFTYTGTGHFIIGLDPLKDTTRLLDTRIECKKETNGKGAIIITSFGRISIIHGMKEVSCTELDDFQDTFIYINILFGHIKILPQDFTLEPLDSNCVVNEKGEIGLQDERPEILCSKETQFKPNDSIALIVKKQAGSYWSMELLVTSFNSSEQMQPIWYVNSKEGQFDFSMDQDYNVSHNGSKIFTSKNKVPLKLWFRIFRAEVTILTLGESDTLGHYNRYVKPPNDVNPDGNHTSNSSTDHHSVDQTSVKQPF